LLEQFGLLEYQRQQTIDLSGGLKRRLQVAKVFMVDKPVVFLDEATTGMDTLNKRATIRAIQEETRKGRTVVLTTHLLEEAEELCDSLVIISQGSVVASGTVDAVKAMGLRLMHVELVFERMRQATLRSLRNLRPLRMEVRNNRVTLTLKDRAGVLAALTSLRRDKELLTFDVSSANLEDVFVELLRPEEGAP
jgi:ABC-2 type transport system ATP-binding protein